MSQLTASGMTRALAMSATATTALLVMLLLAATGASAAARTLPLASQLTNGEVWRDTDGNQIEAHGGAILKIGDVYHRHAPPIPP